MRSHSVANEGRRIAYQQRARSVLPANDLDRTRWPFAATEASAIQAADWQPKMCGILSRLRIGSRLALTVGRRAAIAGWRLRVESTRGRWPTTAMARDATGGPCAAPRARRPRPG